MVIVEGDACRRPPPESLKCFLLPLHPVLDLHNWEVEVRGEKQIGKALGDDSEGKQSNFLSDRIELARFDKKAVVPRDIIVLVARTLGPIFSIFASMLQHSRLINKANRQL